jgi:hypothetical protein
VVWVVHLSFLLSRCYGSGGFVNPLHTGFPFAVVAVKDEVEGVGFLAGELVGDVVIAKRCSDVGFDFGTGDVVGCNASCNGNLEDVGGVG